MKNENRDEIITLISPKNKSIVDVMNEDVRLFTKDYYMGYAASFPYKGDNYAPHSIVLQWQVKDLCDEFIVKVSPVEDFSIIEDYHVNGAKFELFAPFFYDEYFWCVISVDGRYSSRIYSFKIKNQTRPIYIDGVSNTREVFFGNPIEGFKIARNRLYRGGNVDSITELGKEFVKNKLAIKTDLDLRKPAESTASLETSAMGESVKHLNLSGCMYSGLNGNEEGKEGISSEIGSKKLLACLNVFANKDNFPVYVHCVLGRDRTGTVVGVLLALCGVSREEIVYDYELSFFSRIGRDPETDVLKQLGSFYDTLDYLCSFDGSSLRECTENYLLSIGMKRETMELIKRNLAE